MNTLSKQSNNLNIVSNFKNKLNRLTLLNQEERMGRKRRYRLFSTECGPNLKLLDFEKCRWQNRTLKTFEILNYVNLQLIFYKCTRTTRTTTNLKNPNFTKNEIKHWTRDMIPYQQKRWHQHDKKAIVWNYDI